MRTILVTLLSVAGLAAVSAIQSPGKATGTLTVGTSAIRLAHAAAFPAPGRGGKEACRILLTDKPLTPSAVKHAVAAATDDDARQDLAVELADGEIRGLEAVVGADRTVTRLNIYSADSAMGMMMLAKGEFQATTLDATQVAGRFSTAAPIEDARIGKTIRFDVTFAAPVRRAP